MKGLEGKEVINRDYREQSVNIGITLTKMTRQELIELLKKYSHVFAWIPTDMGGFDRELLEHKLMIRPGTKEIKQKNKFGEDTKTR